MVFYDAWEVAGDGSPGFTWSNRNPLAAVGLYPNRRFDYILSAWPRRGGAGHPVHCALLGVRPGERQLSDHYGLVAACVTDHHRRVTLGKAGICAAAIARLPLEGPAGSPWREERATG